jgi:hypothetical protein
MNRCNYCHMKFIKNRANRDGMKVTTLRDARWGMGGVNVYVHPASVDIKSIEGGEDGERSKYRQAWFMELTQSCAC